jgi:hypothetical protein
MTSMTQGRIIRRLYLPAVAGLLAGTGWNLCAVGVASAHHGYGNFQLNRSMEFSGTIKRLEFVNPHAYLHVDAVGSDGKPIVYKCEMRGATVLRHSGWTKDLFVVGEKISVQAAPDRKSPTSCYVVSLLLANGIRLDRYGQHAVATAQKPARHAISPNVPPDLAGTWAAEQYVMTDPRGLGGGFLPVSQIKRFAVGEVPANQVSAVPPSSPLQTIKEFYKLASGAARLHESIPFLGSPFKLTAAGKAAAVPEASVLPAMNCQFTSVVFDWTWESQVNRIAVRDDAVVMEYGQYGFQRTIHLNQSSHPAQIEPSRAGHSIGHWEGKTLVVDTIGFSPGLIVGGPGGVIPHSDQLHLVERFDYDPAQRSLTRHYTAEDQKYFAEPHEGSDVVKPTALPFMPDECNDTSPIGARETK